MMESGPERVMSSLDSAPEGKYARVHEDTLDLKVDSYKPSQTSAKSPRD